MTKQTRATLKSPERFRLYDWLRDQAKEGHLTGSSITLAAKASNHLKFLVTPDTLIRVAKAAGVELPKGQRYAGYTQKNRTRRLTQCVLRLAEALQTIDPALVPPGTMAELQNLLKPGASDPEAPVA
jgi:hypothetical protein